MPSYLMIGDRIWVWGRVATSIEDKGRYIAVRRGYGRGRLGTITQAFTLDPFRRYEVQFDDGSKVVVMSLPGYRAMVKRARGRKPRKVRG